MNAEEFLAHFGVKGMRWGVRKRTPEQERRRAEKWKSRQARIDKEDAKHLRDLKKQIKIERALGNDTSIMEYEVANFRPRDAKKIYRGRAIAGGLLATYGTYKVAKGISRIGKE